MVLNKGPLMARAKAAARRHGLKGGVSEEVYTVSGARDDGSVHGEQGIGGEHQRRKKPKNGPPLSPDIHGLIF